MSLDAKIEAAKVSAQGLCKSQWLAWNKDPLLKRVSEQLHYLKEWPTRTEGIASTLYDLFVTTQTWLTLVEDAIPVEDAPTSQSATLPGKSPARERELLPVVRKLYFKVLDALRAHPLYRPPEAGEPAEGPDPSLVRHWESVFGRTNGGFGEDARQWSNNNGMTYAIWPGQRARYRVWFRKNVDGKSGVRAVRWDDVRSNPAASGYRLFDTTDSRESQPGTDLRTHFVLRSDGRLYCGFNRLADLFYHSSLVGGAKALCAGRIRFDRGKVTLITNESGHYRPTAQSIQVFLERLRSMRIDLNHTCTT